MADVTCAQVGRPQKYTNVSVFLMKRLLSEESFELTREKTFDMQWSGILKGQQNVSSCIVGLMIMASHHTFPSQIKHMSSQIKFGPTNFLHIINGNFMEFAKENECLDNFQSLS